IDIKSEEEKRRELETKMADMVISGAPVSVLVDHGLPEAILEILVGAGIGTVEKLGSMTPEELEAIPGIDEETVSQIQSTVVSFYGQYEEEAPESETAPATAEELENVIEETESEEAGLLEGAEQAEPLAFQNIETGVLEHDLARHEPALLEEIDKGEVLDLGRVEGLSGAPSALRSLVESDENGDAAPSDTIKNTE
ncbi:MAG: hypothetical protein JO138_00665, partial [Acidobacteriaceae bacterium]|nr:hypothetical protein [Acidobacteriaceae bacterium]